MSSMDTDRVTTSSRRPSLIRNASIALASVSLLAIAPTTTAQTGVTIERPSAQLTAQQPRGMMQAIYRWETLTNSRNTDLGFASYAGFVLAYPDFPKSTLIRVRAENALDSEAPTTQELLTFFDKNPPLTNSGKARYALALSAANRSEALEMARGAWRGGEMSGTAEAYLVGMFGSQLTQDDHDQRMDALLWQGDAEAAARQSIYVDPAQRDIFLARLALVEGNYPSSLGLTVPTDANSDPGYVYNLSRFYRQSRNMPAAITLLANRPKFETLPLDGEEFVAEMLTVAKAASVAQTVAITSKTDDLFAPGTDISQGSFRLRDKFTDLMWMGGTNALWRQDNGSVAAPMFNNYGEAAKTPLTRSKGFYWAGRALREAGDESGARTHFMKAAQYADQYYGQLAIEAMGAQMPKFVSDPQVAPSADERAAFNQQPLVRALRAMANNRQDWRTERAFFSEISAQAKTPSQMAMVGDLARELGLNEMAVVAGATAPEHDLSGFERLAHPTVDVPYGTNWTMAHAIMRQESEFDRTRVSHAGARGLMQLMPGTAREQAGKLGMNYMSASLTGDTQYNIRLGDSYFKRMLDYYDGSYPLALGAYNAGPGRVNQWIRMNGDPRTGAIDYQTWIEKIPANFETRYYIMRVLGNAVAYGHIYPEKAGTARTIDYYLR